MDLSPLVGGLGGVPSMAAAIDHEFGHIMEGDELYEHVQEHRKLAATIAEGLRLRAEANKHKAAEIDAEMEADDEHKRRKTEGDAEEAAAAGLDAVRYQTT